MRIHELLPESLLPTSAFAGSKKNKLGPAGQLKGSMKRAARQGDLVGEQGDQTVAEKTDADLCRSSKRLGSSDHSSCVSQGLRAHQSKGKGHTDGQGNYIKGKKIRGSKYGGPLPDWDSK
jgi:hypothetical protein